VHGKRRALKVLRAKKLDSRANQVSRLSSPLISPLIILAMISSCSLSAIDTSSLTSPRRRAISRRYTFLGRSAGDGEKGAAIGLGETAVALGQVGRDRERGTIQLLDEESELEIKLRGCLTP
jgi:hypothetical protein